MLAEGRECKCHRHRSIPGRPKEGDAVKRRRPRVPAAPPTGISGVFPETFSTACGRVGSIFSIRSPARQLSGGVFSPPRPSDHPKACRHGLAAAAAPVSMPTESNRIRCAPCPTAKSADPGLYLCTPITVDRGHRGCGGRNLGYGGRGTGVEGCLWGPMRGEPPRATCWPRELNGLKPLTQGVDRVVLIFPDIDRAIETVHLLQRTCPVPISGHP